MAWDISALLAVADVREKSDLPCPLDRACDLGLMAAAAAGDPRGADLALV
jgi:hypothetical protein